MLASFFSRSAFNGPTPFKYSMGVANMCDEEEIMNQFKKVSDKMLGIPVKTYCFTLNLPLRKLRYCHRKYPELIPEYHNAVKVNASFIE